MGPSRHVAVTSPNARLALCRYRDVSERTLRDLLFDGPIADPLVVRRPTEKSTGNEFSVVFGEDLPALENAVAVDRIELAQARSAAGLVRRD